jgi:putative transposase
MKKTRYTTEQIIMNLRKVEVMIGQGKTIQESCREIGVNEQTYYRWRNKYGGMSTDEAKKLKALEKENERLKKIVADLSVDNAVLKEVVEGKF